MEVTTLSGRDRTGFLGHTTTSDGGLTVVLGVGTADGGGVIVKTTITVSGKSEWEAEARAMTAYQSLPEVLGFERSYYEASRLPGDSTNPALVTLTVFDSQAELKPTTMPCLNAA